MCITESIYPELWVLTKYLNQSYVVQCSVFNADRVNMTTTTMFWFSMFYNQVKYKFKKKMID